MPLNWNVGNFFNIENAFSFIHSTEIKLLNVFNGNKYVLEKVKYLDPNKICLTRSSNAMTCADSQVDCDVFRGCSDL